MAGKVIMPNSHGSFKGRSHCVEADGGKGRDASPAAYPVGGRVPRHCGRELTVSLYVRTLLKVMFSAYAATPYGGARQHDGWRRAAGRESRAYGVVVYAVVLCVLPVATEGFCPVGCMCDYSSMRVSCEGAGLDAVPILLNPRVQNLLLHNNSIASLSESLVFYHDLLLLDLSGNDLTSLGNYNFREQRQLLELRLGHNKLESIGPGSLRGLVRLEQLMLHHNAITHIEDGAFEATASLTELDLSYNKLRAVGAAGVRGLGALERLDLSGNRMTRVPGGDFTNLTGLRHLNLTHNLLSQVPPRAFSGFLGLVSLVLDKNNISVVDTAAFVGMAELRHLSLADNRLEAVPSASLAALLRLQSLDLSGNLFEILSEDCFRGLRSLETLVVSRCPRLYTVSGEAFLSTGGLHSLTLSHNPRLAALPPTALAHLLTLRHLDLSACGLRTLTPTQVNMSRRPRHNSHKWWGAAGLT